MAHSDPFGALRSARRSRVPRRRVVDCFACPRLVAWREEQARVKVARVPGRGVLGAAGAGVRGSGGWDPDRRARAGGARREPDRAGVHRRLVRGLPVAVAPRGWAGRPGESRRAGDGLTLGRVRIAAAVRCAPPANKPTPEEQATCRPYLVREIRLLPRLRVLLALGAIGWAAALRCLAELGHEVPRPAPRFGHGAEVEVGPYVLLGSYHVSRRTRVHRKVTRPMFESVLERAKALGATDKVPEPPC